jgi:hypothetical protein
MRKRFFLFEPYYKSPSSDTLMNLSWGINDGEAENLFDSKASFSPSSPHTPGLWAEVGINTGKSVECPTPI